MARLPGSNPRRFFLDLSSPAFDDVLAFVTAAFPAVPTSHALRELLLLAVSQNPDATARAAAYRTALRSARGVVYAAAQRALVEAAGQLAVDAQGAAMLDGEGDPA